MAGEEPSWKKGKFISSEEEEKDHFVWFHENKLFELKSALSSLREPLSGYGVTVSKIVFCDAVTDKSFGNATCRCKELRIGNDKYPKGYSVINIFQHGIDMIEAYVKSPKNIPERKGAKLALFRLLKFWSSISGSTEEALSNLPAIASETELTVAVAHHLLSKLTVAGTYILDKVSTGKNMKKNHTCTCGCGDKILGTFGETSLGVESYWHGRVDILMDVAVRILPTEDPDLPGGGNQSSIEKSTKVKMASSRDQIRAQTIVSSFLMRKNHPELDNFLIPTIVLSESHVAVCLYDCENDILLETPLLGLFQQGNDKLLSKATIIVLWLALNFKYCCSGVPDKIIETGYTADFFKHIGPVLETYKNDVVAPCDYVAECEWAVLPVFETLPKKEDIKNVNKIPDNIEGNS